MGQKYWIKLYIEILDDPKMGTLPDRLYRRVIELFLMAGAERNDGKLPSIESMAWKLRLSQDELLDDLRKIEPTGIVTEVEPWIWVVTKFAERQAPSDPTAVTRMQHYRERNAKRNNPVTNNDLVTQDVTRNNPVTLRVDNRIESDKNRIEAEQPAAAAFTKFQNEIGMLTPKTSEIVGGWIDDYSDAWVCDAIDEAVRNNARKPNYIDAILKRWKTDGRNGSKPAKPNGKQAVWSDEVDFT